MSSTTEASASSRRWVYWARPGADLAQVVGEGRLEAVEGVGPLHPDGAEVADVEGHGVAGGRPGARRWCRRRRPAASPTRRSPPASPRAHGGPRPGRCASACPAGSWASRSPEQASRRRWSGRTGHGALPGACAGQPVLGQQGQGVALVQQGHPDVGVQLGHAPDLAVLLGDQSLVERGHLDEQARAGQPEVGTEGGRRAQVRTPVEDELDRLVLPVHAVEVEDPCEALLRLVGEADAAAPGSGAPAGARSRLTARRTRLRPGRRPPGGDSSGPCRRRPSVRSARRWRPRVPTRPRRAGAR